MSEGSPMPRRVVIVGAGIVGLSTAWWLARRGVESIVLDREDPLSSASAGNAGLLSIGHYPLTRPGASWRGLRWMANRRSPLYIRPTLDPRMLSWLWTFHRHCNAAWSDRCLDSLCRMGFPALEAFETIIAEESIDCDYARDGWLEVVLDAATLRHAEEEARALVPFGYEVSTLDGAALRAAHPVFRERCAGAVRYHDSARCNPGRFLGALLDAVRRRGVAVRLDATVVEVLAASSPRDGASRVQHWDAPSVPSASAAHEVRLPGGEIVECDAVVVAAGAWSASIIEPLGHRLPLVAARGYHLHYEQAPAMPGTGCVLRERSVAVTPMGRALRLAGTLEIGSLGRPWLRDRIDAITDGARAYMHGIESLGSAQEWAGYRPCTPDGMPVIGPLPSHPRVIVATGHAMMGMTLGPVSGRAVAELLLGEPPSVDLSMLRADRFGSTRRTPSRVP